MLNLVEHWVIETVIMVGSEKDDIVREWKQILFEPERLKAEAEARSRIKDAVKGQQGYLNIKPKDKPAPAPFDLSQLSGRLGSANIKQTSRAPTSSTSSTGPKIAVNPDGELDVT